MTTKRTRQKHYCGKTSEPIASDSSSMEQINRQGERDDISFFQHMVELGFEPTLETADHRGSQPMRVGPGPTGPCIRSNADFS